MKNALSRLAQIRKSNERGEFTLLSVIVSVTLLALIMALVTPAIISTQNARVTIETKSDVSTISALIADQLASRYNSEPMTIDMRSEGCGGTPIVMATIPVSVNPTSCLIATGDQDHFFVTITAHRTDGPIVVSFDNQPVVLSGGE